MDISSTNASNSSQPTNTQSLEQGIKAQDFEALLKTYDHKNLNMPKALDEQPIKRLFFHLLAQLQIAGSQHIASALSDKIKKLLKPLEQLLFDLFDHAKMALIHPKNRSNIPTEQRLNWLYEETHFFYDNYANTLKRNTYTEKLLKGIHESIQAFRGILPNN